VSRIDPLVEEVILGTIAMAMPGAAPPDAPE
jgi:hypothetical protein